MDNIKLVIQILEAVIQRNQMDPEKLDEAIELLESVKDVLTDDEVIDIIDEIQDYLQYLMAIEEPIATEETKELLGIVEKLKQWPK